MQQYEECIKTKHFSHYTQPLSSFKEQQSQIKFSRLLEIQKILKPWIILLLLSTRYVNVNVPTVLTQASLGTKLNSIKNPAFYASVFQTPVLCLPLQ